MAKPKLSDVTRAQLLWARVRKGEATEAELAEYKRLKALIRKALNKT